jgi:hypothetical protein
MSVARAAFAHRADEFFTAVGEDLPTLPASRDRDEADYGEREREADHHAENESEHSSRVTAERARTQTEPPPETKL